MISEASEMFAAIRVFIDLKPLKQLQNTTGVTCMVLWSGNIWFAELSFYESFCVTATMKCAIKVCNISVITYSIRLEWCSLDSGFRGRVWYPNVHVSGKYVTNVLNNINRQYMLYTFSPVKPKEPINFTVLRYLPDLGLLKFLNLAEILSILGLEKLNTYYK